MIVQSSALGLVLALTSAGLAVAQDMSLQARADQMVEACGAPGGIVAYWEGEGSDVEVRVAGVRSLSNAHPVTVNDFWHIGSNTKAMTATLAARLVEQGQISWDDTLADVLAEYGFQIQDPFRDVTLEDLLNHTGGFSGSIALRDFDRFAGTNEARDERADRIDYARQALNEDPEGPRGEFVYSNTGFILAALMLETRAGEPYEVLIQREVFDPLGMESAGWGPPEGEDQPVGHVARFLRGPKEIGMLDNPPVMNSAGRVHISAQDHMKFAMAHSREAMGPTSDYLTQASWEKLHTPRAGHDYVMGWGLYEGVLVHGGSNTAWIEQIAFDRNAHTAALAAVNYGHQGKCMPATGEVLMKLLAIDPE